MTAISWKYWQDEKRTPTSDDERSNARMEFATAHPDDARLMITGYWRIEGARTKPSWPVGIWTDEGKEAIGSIFQIGANKVMNTVENAKEWDEFLGGGWLHCIAVSFDDYNRAIETGFWPSDNKPARQMTADERLGIDTNAGSNNAPIDELLSDQIAAVVEKVKATKVTDQASADAASGLLDKLRKLLEKAEAERVAEKEPFLEGGRTVDAKWSAIRDPGKVAGEALKAARDAWLKAEQARLDRIAAEENRKRREAADAAAAAETERLRKEYEAAGQQIDETEIAERVVTTIAPVEEVVAPKAKASSDFGRATSAKKVKRAVVTDPVSLVQHFFDTKDEDFEAYLAQRVTKAWRGKILLPGAKVVEE